MYSGSRLISVRNITMFRQLESHNFLFRLILGSLIIAGGLLFVPLLITSTNARGVEAQSANLPYDSLSSTIPDNPNAVTAGLASIVNEVKLTAYQINDGAAKSTRSAADMSSKAGKSIASGMTHTAKVTVHGISSVTSFIATTTGKGLSFTFRMPSAAVSSVTNTSLVKNFVRPSEYEEVSIIDPNSPALLAALAALPPKTEGTELAHLGDDSGPIWPINGRVTANFGVPHRPYQPTHRHRHK